MKGIYESLLNHPVIDEAGCISWIRGLEPKEILRRFGNGSSLFETTLPGLENEMDRVRGGDYMKSVFGVIAGSISDEWVLAVEPNGYLAVSPETRQRLSKNSEIISLFWNVNALAEFSFAQNGATKAVLSDLLFFTPEEDGEKPTSGFKDIEGEQPELVSDLLVALAKSESLDWYDPVMDWVLAYTGLKHPETWIDQTYLAIVIEDE